jgi:hypothetical protein
MAINDIKIEGLDPYQDYDMSASEDTPPGLIRIWFSLESVFMPFLSAQEGRKVDKNFIYMNWEKELGRSIGRQRINDVVEFDETTQKWKIKSFAPQESHIKTYPNEWNAFFNNTRADDAGTPVELLFKNDPARASLYKHHGVHTIERLSGVSEGDAALIGMGALDDVKRAKAFIAKTNTGVSNSQFELEVQALKERNESLENSVRDLTEKLTEMLKRELSAGDDDSEPAKKRGRPFKNETIGV